MITEPFRYVAIDTGGQRRRGLVHAADRQDAFRRVSELALTPLRVERTGASGPAFSFQRTNSSDIADLSRELAVLVEARIPLAKGLSSIAEHETKPALRDMVRDVATRIESGMASSTALEQYREEFGEVYIETIRAAEKSGNLPVVMAHLADMLDRQIEARQQFKRALTYPVIVMGVVALAVGVIVIFVVPKFAATFSGQGVQMPFITRLLQAVGEFAKANWLLLVPGGAAAVFGLRAYLRTETGKITLENFLARFPYIRRIVTASTTGQFARVFSIGLSSGLDVIESVEISGRATGRRTFVAECDALAERLRRGEDLADVIRSSRSLPSFAKRMLCAGRDATELSRSCGIVARHYDREAGHLTKNVNTVIEPVLTVLLAVIVLGVALSVFLPMWQIIKVNHQAAEAHAMRTLSPRFATTVRAAPRSAFTFVEIMVVVVLIGIIAAIVIPRFGNVTDEARTAALQSIAGGVRASISSYRTSSVISGAAAYPTLAQLTAPGLVVENEIEANPFTNVRGVRAVSAAQAAARAVINPTQYGWNYYVDNAASPPTAVFYANCSSATTATDSAGAVLNANQL